MAATSQNKSLLIVVTIFFVCLFCRAEARGAAPAAPTGLAGVVGNGELSLTWNPVSGAGSYLLYRATVSGGPYSFIAETTGNGHTDRGLSNSTSYYYVVTAVNVEGESPYSAAVTKIPVNSVLAAPAEVKAIPGNGEISLTWNPVTSAVSYNVFRSLSRGGPYTALTPAAPGPCFTDRDLSNGTRYFYVVQTKSTNVGAYSNEADATPSALLSLAPLNLSVTPGSTWAALSWSVSEGAASYALYRGTSPGGPYSFVAMPNATQFEDFGLSNGIRYYYVVAAVNAEGRGAFAIEANALVADTERPHATVLSATRSGSGAINLSWDSAAGAVSYTVWRSEDPGGPYDFLNLQNSGGYGDTNLTNNTPYYYTVKVHNSSADEPISNEVGITPLSQMPTPGNVAVIPGNTQATLTWSPVAGATSYYVEVRWGTGRQYLTGGYSSSLSFTAMNLTNSVPFYFQVQALGTSGSAFSAEVTTTPAASRPKAPENVSVIVGNTQATIQWQLVSGATSYQIFRRSETGVWSSTPIGTATGAMFTDTGLSNGERYYYQVAAVNANGAGAWSANVIEARPTANATAAPLHLTITPGNTQATLTWEPVVGASDYYVTIATSPGGPYVAGGYDVGLGFTATGLTNGVPYYFRVQSRGGSTNSSCSAEVSVTPAENLPMAPVNLGLDAGNTRLSLHWDAVVDASGYRIFRRTETGPWPAEPVAQVSGTLFTDTGLSNGSRYFYEVLALNAGNDSGARSSSGSNAVPTPRATSAPAGLVVIPGNTQATATWEPVIGASSYYVIYSISPGGPYFGGNSVSDFSYTAAGLTNGVPYYFRVQSLGGAFSSAFSAEAGVTPAVVLPMAPANLTIALGNAQATVDWEAVSGATGYQVFRRTEGAAWPATPVATTTGTIFMDTALTNGLRYYYLVAAMNANGAGAKAVNAVSGIPNNDLPLAPTNLAVVAGSGQATITWNPVAGATSYYVTGSTSSGGGVSITAAPTDTMHTAAGLSNGVSYYFRIQACGPSGCSSSSTEVSVTPVSGLPPAPENLSIVAGNTELSLRWNAVSGATGYQVFRRGEAAAWPATPLTTTTGTLLIDTGLTNGVKYYYLVAAMNANGAGAWAANAVEGIPLATAPMAPTNVSGLAGDTRATITWDPVDGTGVYYVTGATSSGGGIMITAQVDVPIYVATGLTNGQTYYFKVQAYKDGFWSGYSTEVSVTPSMPAGSGVLLGRVSVNFAGYSDLSVRDATVRLEGTDYSTTTDANGYFKLASIPFGTYQLLISAPNMKPVQQELVLSQADQQVTPPQMTVYQPAVCHNGDINSDGKVGLEDAVLILQVVTGLRN